MVIIGVLQGYFTLPSHQLRFVLGRLLCSPFMITRHIIRKGECVDSGPQLKRGIVLIGRISFFLNQRYAWCIVDFAWSFVGDTQSQHECVRTQKNTFPAPGHFLSSYINP